MGFFSSLWEGAKVLAAGAAAVVTAPLWGPVIAVDEVGKRIWGNNKQEVQQISQAVSKTEALTETSTVAQVEDISKTVREFYKKYAPVGEAKEEAAQKNIEKFFDGIKNLLQKERQLANDYGMSKLNSKKDRLCRDIEGTITDAIRTKLSLDDSECKKILSMQAGDEKSRKMKEFAERTIQNANKDLENKIRTAMREVKDDITRFLQNKMDEQEEKAQRDQQEFDNWIRQIENKTFDSERAQLEPRIKIYAIEQVEKILAA